MSGSSGRGNRSGAGRSQNAQGAAHGSPDPALIAEKVYRLLLADARLSRARGELPRPRKR